MRKFNAPPVHFAQTAALISACAFAVAAWHLDGDPQEHHRYQPPAQQLLSHSQSQLHSRFNGGSISRAKATANAAANARARAIAAAADAATAAWPRSPPPPSPPQALSPPPPPSSPFQLPTEAELASLAAEAKREWHAATLAHLEDFLATAELNGRLSVARQQRQTPQKQRPLTGSALQQPVFRVGSEEGGEEDREETRRAWSPPKYAVAMPGLVTPQAIREETAAAPSQQRGATVNSPGGVEVVTEGGSEGKSLGAMSSSPSPVVISFGRWIQALHPENAPSAPGIPPRISAPSVTNPLHGSGRALESDGGASGGENGGAEGGESGGGGADEVSLDGRFLLPDSEYLAMWNAHPTVQRLGGAVAPVNMTPPQPSPPKPPVTTAMIAAAAAKHWAQQADGGGGSSGDGMLVGFGGSPESSSSSGMLVGFGGGSSGKSSGSSGSNNGGSGRSGSGMLVGFPSSSSSSFPSSSSSSSPPPDEPPTIASVWREHWKVPIEPFPTLQSTSKYAQCSHLPARRSVSSAIPTAPLSLLTTC